MHCLLRAPRGRGPITGPHLTYGVPSGKGAEAAAPAPPASTAPAPDASEAAAPEQPAPQSVHVVIARYREDAAWLGRLHSALRAPHERMFIYEKGEPLPPEHEARAGAAGAQCVPLPNVGREAHTYLHHVLQHWDSLPDVLFFSQGCITDHGYVNEPGEVRRRFLDLAPELPHSQNFELKQLDCHLSGGRLTAYRGPLAPVGQPIWDWFDTTMERPDVRTRGGAVIPVSLAAIFSVRRECVRSRPRAFYEALRDALAAAGRDAELAHFLERAWYYVFGLDTALPKATSKATSEA
jgi:hypothetical protein